jgi:tRNA(adenine34) deaminase
MDDFFFMGEALAEARDAASLGEIPVGAVVVYGGEIIGRGGNRRALEALPFAHAEMRAISEACRALKRWRLDGCVIYVTLEPCVMCAGAIVQTRVTRLVFGADDPKAGGCGSLYDITNDPRMYHRCEVRRGVMAGESAALLKDFFRAKRAAAKK